MKIYQATILPVVAWKHGVEHQRAINVTDAITVEFGIKYHHHQHGLRLEFVIGGKQPVVTLKYFLDDEEQCHKLDLRKLKLSGRQALAIKTVSNVTIYLNKKGEPDPKLSEISIVG